MKKYNSQDMEKLEEKGREIVLRIASFMNFGVESEEVQKEIGAYHLYMGNFYDCSKEMFLRLGRLYSDDEQFSKFYEDIHDGLAGFMTEAIEYYCE